MKKTDFWFDLPQNLIAQHPSEKRDHSKMLVLDRNSGEIIHKNFYNILDYLDEGDTLILNDSRVLPARIFGSKKDTGAIVEFLLLEQKQLGVWEVMVKPGKKAKPGSEFIFGNGILTCEVAEVLDGGNRLVHFNHEQNSTIYEVLEKIGEMPLPPYITEKLQDKERYQTVYSRELGSAAAPTAGLHFTKEILEQLKQKGVNIGFVTLHVGLGTFRPVKVDNITEHKMHSEHYFMPKETANLINDTKKAGKRVFAVGTTSCRTIESVAMREGCIKESDGYTDIFIYPGYKFQVLDGLITNFHLPESTLIMLVSAFAGYDNTMNAYKVAIENSYRFFSFGDSMLIK